jgi:putative tricarboxylic transport membrane protein
MIPILTLAVPGSAPAAVLLAAMFIHGIRPGPLIMVENPDFVFQVVAMVFMATLAMLVLGLALTRPLLRVLSVPRERLMPIIFVLCTIGSFAIAGRVFDIWVMLFFGIVGFAMREMDYPMAPLVLGIVLGPLLDRSFRRGMVLFDGDFSGFVRQPIAAVLAAACVVMVVASVPAVRRGVGAVVRRVRR